MLTLRHGAIVGGRFRILATLGAGGGTGGGGQTFLAEDLLDGGRVALKVARGSLAAVARREFELLSGVVYPHLPSPVAGVALEGEIDSPDGDENAAFAVAHVFVEGATLVGSAGWDTVAQPLADIASALALLHRLGIVHGDVKPANVLVDAGGRGVLLDLGCATRGDQRRDAVSGTRDYLSPEARRGESSPRADVYAFGALARDTALLRAGCPPRLSDLFAACLAPLASSRPSMDECHRVLVGGPPPIARALLESQLVGRHDALAAFDAFDAFDARGRAEPGSAPRILFVSGPARSGKTRLLRVFTQRSASVVVPGRPNASGLAFAAARLATTPPDASVLVVIDDVDRIAPSDRAAFAALLADGTHPHLRFAFAGAAWPASLRANRTETSHSLRSVMLATVAMQHIELGPLEAHELRPWLDRVDARSVLQRLPPEARFVGAVLAEVDALGGLRAASDERPARGPSEASPSLPDDSEVSREPARHVSLAETFARTSEGAQPDQLRFAAHVFEQNGRPREALTLAARALRRTPSGERDACRLVAARAAARLGSKHARRRLEALLATSGPHAELRLSAAAELVLVLVKESAFSRAVERIEALAPELATPQARLGGTASHLRITEALARAALGDVRHAESALEEARRMLPEHAAPRLVFRLENTAAILAYRAGDLDRAKRDYRRACEAADTAGLDDLLVSGLSNLGVAAHQVGDWGDALRAYERGQERARRRGDTRAAVTLEFNLARLHADIGAFARARELALQCEGSAESPRHDVIRGGSRALVAEIALAEGDGETFDREIGRARSSLRHAGADRELAELELLEAERERTSERADASLARAERLTATARTSGWTDLEARALGSQGLALKALGRSPEAVGVLERAREIATTTARRPLVAELSAQLATVYEEAGALTLAEAEARSAAAAWERSLANLPASLRSDFRGHPHRRIMRTEARPAQGDTLARFRLLLGVHRRLAAATEVDPVLNLTMDAALSLSGAERGFLLLAPGEGQKRAPTVAIAKNMDKEAVHRARVKFSRRIAERVLRTGESVLTDDAELEPTLATSRSVHAMKLRSVLSVPVRDERGIVGALYLDNRFRPRAFDADALELVGALADQAGIALGRARLLRELANKTVELDAERTRAEAHLADVSREVAALRGAPPKSRSTADEFGAIAGRSAGMVRVLDIVRRVRDVDVPVLVRGESGTGKELVARALHETGGRRVAPFAAINCGALPEALLEAELFGYERGAFTGATTSRTGLFVEAGEGTVFFDEVGEMSLAMQVKLLRVLQENEVRPLGSSEVRKVRARAVFATHRDLRREVEAGRFREDLFFRIAVVEVEVPPLRDRIEDIPILAEAILARVAGTDRPKRLTTDALRVLARMPWPGNVRQLENVLRRAIVFTEGERIDVSDLGIEAEVTGARRGRLPGEAQRIRAALDTHGWSVVDVSRALGIPRASLYRKLARYKITRPR